MGVQHELRATLGPCTTGKFAMPKFNSKYRNSTPAQHSRAENDEYLCNLISDILWITHYCPEYAPVFTSHDGAERVVLDVQLESDRYVLIRAPQAEQKAPSLSPREKEIVRMVAQGYQNKVIAAEFNISLWTVCTHMRRVFAKIGVTSRASMVAELSDLGAPAKLKSHLDNSLEGAVIDSNEPVQEGMSRLMLKSGNRRRWRELYAAFAV